MNFKLSALLLVTLAVWANAAPQTLREPSSMAEVLKLVKAGVPGGVIAETVLRSGISFEPTESVLNEFRQAGATDAVLRALQETWRWESKGPLKEKDILELLAEHLPNDRVLSLIRQRPIGFEPSEEYFQGLRSSGVKDDVIDALRACAKRPFSRDYLLQLLASGQDAGQIPKLVEVHGIDFAPSEDNLVSLGSAGAPEALLQAVREARQFNAAHVLCPPATTTLPVFPSLDDTTTVVARLDCGERVMIERKDSGSPGLVKVLLVNGREGFVQGSYLVPSDPRVGVSAPRPTYKPKPPYTRQARRAKLQGTVDLMIVIDAQGNVTDARETSKPLGKGLDENAIETVKTWKFEPATHGGVPVPVRVIVEITFRLNP